MIGGVSEPGIADTLCRVLLDRFAGEGQALGGGSAAALSAAIAAALVERCAVAARADDAAARARELRDVLTTTADRDASAVAALVDALATSGAEPDAGTLRVAATAASEPPV